VRSRRYSRGALLILETNRLLRLGSAANAQKSYLIIATIGRQSHVANVLARLLDWNTRRTEWAPFSPGLSVIQRGSRIG
jgi:hypothetical protein